MIGRFRSFALSASQQCIEVNHKSAKPRRRRCIIDLYQPSRSTSFDGDRDDYVFLS